MKNQVDDVELTVLKFLNQVRVIMSPEELVRMVPKHLGFTIPYSLAFDLFYTFQRRQKDMGVVA